MTFLSKAQNDNIVLQNNICRFKRKKYNKMLGVITITTENRYNAVKVILMYWSGNLLFYASLWHCSLIGIGIKNDIFQSCGHCWVFQFCWHIECGTLKTSLSLLAILWNPAFRWVCLSFSPLPFATLLFSVTCKASSDKPFCHFAFLFPGDGFDR